jgi:uncharacterized protein
MVFAWDPSKAAANLAKHGVGFDDATTVWGDERALDGPDERHSSGEPRRLALGRSAAGRVVVVAYTIRRNDDGEAIRIISARPANRKERAGYAAKD